MRVTFPIRCLPVAALAAVLACTPPGGGPAPRAGYTVALVDSVAWETLMDEGFLRRVEVRGAGRVDTIPDIETRAMPVAVGGEVRGIAYDRANAAALFRYDAGPRRLEYLSLPRDVHPYFGMPAVSPDGRHLAFVEAPGDATSRGVVRVWPGGPIVLQTPWVRVPETDFTGNTVRWLDAARVEFLIDISDTHQARFRATLPGGPITADTVTAAQLQNQ